MPKGAKTKAGSKTRDRILEATIELVCEHGYAPTSVNMVCERVGIAKTALYWHFGNRNGLMQAVIDALTHEFIGEIRSNVFLVGTPQERQQQMINGMRDIVENRASHFRALLSAVVDRDEMDPYFREACLRVTDATIQAIADGVRSTIGIDLPDMDLFGHTLIALMVGALRRKLMDPDGVDLDRLFEDFEHLTNMMIRDRLKRYQKEMDAQKKAKKEAAKDAPQSSKPKRKKAVS